MRHSISGRLSIIVVLALAGLPFALADGATTRNVPSALYPTIQSGINACANGDTVLVADGTYTGVGNRNLNFSGRAITVRSENGPADCIIDAGSAARGFIFSGGETANAVVEGFTITNGDTVNDGGAFTVANSDPTIRNCIIYNCEASALGGAMSFSASDSVVENCVIVGNESVVAYGGGLAFGVGSTVTVVNCTIADNRADAGGAFHAVDSNPTFINCILYDDSTDETSVVGTSAPTLNYCDIEGGWLGAGTGNIDDDPMFTNRGTWNDGTFTNGDYVILPTSPCIDAGFGDSGVTVPAQDLLGNDRYDDPTVANTGDGTPDYVDLGAYELQAAPPEPVSYADIVWRETTTGEVGVWLMRGLTLEAGGVPSTPALAWVIQGVGDFDGNGRADILWRNTGTGSVAIWLMNGTTLVGGFAVATVAPAAGWDIQGVGDFNGNGRADVLWRNTGTNQIAIWLMNGSTISSAGVVQTVAAAWAIEGTGDFNGNGNDDILWRNTLTGQVAIWLMSGLTMVNAGIVATVDPAANDYDIQGVGDFDGDGNDDVLWRETTTGEVAIWIMNGLAIANGGVVAIVDPVAHDWHIQGVGDLNGVETP